MSDEIKTQGDVVRAARKGMRLKAIAARAGMTKQELEVRLEADRNFKLVYENAVADYEEEQREEIEKAKLDAIAKGDASLRYKIAREAIKELNERDGTGRVLVVQTPKESNLLEPDYEEHSEEELAAIRAATESEASKDGE